jgi:hypothetical protein
MLLFETLEGNILHTGGHFRFTKKMMSQRPLVDVKVDILLLDAR